MKTPTLLKSLLTPGLALALGVTFLAATAEAAPYACDLTNSAGIVSFRLNENADNVKVISSGGAVTNNLGPGLKGLTVTNLGVASGTIKVVVARTAASGYAQISTDGLLENGVYVNKFEQPRGLAVNKNPATPSFGRIFVANTREGTTAGSYVRVNHEGIYMINSDNTVALGTGTTPRNAGLVFDTGVDDAVSPFRLTIGKDDNMLYMADLSDARGGLWVTDLDVTTGTNALDIIGDAASSGATTHGSTYAAVVEGSVANSNLRIFTMDEDLSPIRSAWRYDVDGGSFPFTGSPTSLGQAMINTTIDLAKGGSSNYLYASQNRSAGTDAPSIFVFTADGTSITNSLDAGRGYLGNPAAADLFRNTIALDISPDGSTLALLRGVSFGRVWLVPLKNGVFDFAGTNSFALGLASDSNRDLAYDAAGNLYVVSSSGEWLRIFSRGGSTVASTGSDGTFSLSVPTTTVNVTVDTSNVSEGSPITAVFTFTRQNDPLASPLTVSFTTGGTALRGTDYVLQTNSVTFTGNSVVIPAGQQTMTVSLVVQEDAEAELSETATVGLGGSSAYAVDAPASQTVAIADNEPATADLAVVRSSMYERLEYDNSLLQVYDYARLRVVRRGDTNASLDVNLTYSGTAAAARYAAPPATVAVGQGVVNQNFDLTPVNDSLLNGNQTIIASVASGTGYVVGTNSPSVTATVVDDEVPPEDVLWSENFNADDSANWTVRFGSSNGIPDSRYVFSYDYSSWGWIPMAVPRAPHSTSDTLGCYLTVNKDYPMTGTDPGGAAGINIYPNGKSFSGNYAVRFDMFLVAGNAASTTEYALFGINHSGTKTNWFRNSAGGVPAGWTFDGLWFGVEADAAALGDYVIYSAPTTAGNNPTALTPGRNASTLTGIFKAPPFGYAGAPGNQEISTTPVWADVEISHVSGVVTLTIDRTPIMSYTNAAEFTSGNVMLGYCDAYDSIMTGSSGVIYDNLRVVRLPSTTAPNITRIQIVGGNVEIYFTADASDAPSAFGLQEAGTINGTFGDVSATITGSAGSFKAVRALGGSQQFYRLKRN